MSEDFSKKIGQLMKLSFELIDCSKKNCSKQKKKLMTNKKTGPLYIAYTTETDTHKKLKLLNELSKNNIAYQYDKCVVNHCKKIFKDLMKLLRTFISVIPHTNPKREKLDNMLTKLEKLFTTDKLTKKDYKIYTKNITELMGSLKSS